MARFPNHLALIPSSTQCGTFIVECGSPQMSSRRLLKRSCKTRSNQNVLPLPASSFRQTSVNGSVVH